MHASVETIEMRSVEQQLFLLIKEFRVAWSCFGKNKEILQDKQLPISLKNK